MLFDPDEPTDPVREIGAKLAARRKVTTRLKGLLQAAQHLFQDSSESKPSQRQLAEAIAKVDEALDALEASAERVGNAEASRRCRTTFEFPWLITSRPALLEFLTKRCRLNDGEIACLLVVGDKGKAWALEYIVIKGEDTTEEAIERAHANVRQIVSRERLRRAAGARAPRTRAKRVRGSGP